VDGETLADRLSRGPLPEAEAMRLAEQIAEALAAAHEKGVIHCDLKPANIKMTPDGMVKVLDFGLAKVPKTMDAAGNPAETTSAGLIVGTPAYMSPEQARGAHVDRRTDIWAFGVVIYETLTGNCPFQRETITDTLAAPARSSRRSPSLCPRWITPPAPTDQRTSTSTMYAIACWHRCSIRTSS
jgi:eukaryotic-like serine/threonine-protein kinase